MSTELNIDVEQIDTTGLDPIMAKIVREAAEKGRIAAQEIADKQARAVRGKVMGWKERQAKRKKEEREAKVKDGADICETFIQEIAGPFLRLTQRGDADKIASLKVTLIPGPSDQSRSASVAISDGGKRLRTVYRATLQQLEERDNRLLTRLQEKTGFTAGSPVEMMEEIARLQSQLSAMQNGKEGRVAVCDAAQQVALAYADNRDLEPEMEKLLEAFQN